MLRTLLACLTVLPLLAACGQPHQGKDPPTAAFVARSVVPLGEAVQFDGSWSKDNGLIVAYAFDFGDDSPVLVTFSPHARHSYVTASVFHVTLTVEDDKGNVGHATHQIKVTEEWAPCTEGLDCRPEGECREGECWIARP